MEKTNKQTTAPKKSRIIKVKIHKNTAAEPETLFSPKEIRQFVSEFATAYIRGNIIIRFPTAAELSKKNPLAVGFPTDPSISQEIKIKEHYIEQLLIGAGIKSASKEQQEKAINDIFHMLLMFRSANRIEGKILPADIEKRITTLEEKQQTTNTLVEQITGFLFKSSKEEDKKAITEAPKSKIEG
ncbi:MAG: hypothetical protein GX638_09335 [Crenarchaeota archaeon]|nr:hypothetical protein [Thermoproteota archaeon]